LGRKVRKVTKKIVRRELRGGTGTSKRFKEFIGGLGTGDIKKGSRQGTLNVRPSMYLRRAARGNLRSIKKRGAK